jgi:NAD+ synthase (glutamine-hydrolysing)
VGTPILIDDKLINCAVFISNGKLLGIVPKQTKTRWFDIAKNPSIIFDGYDVPISEDIIFSSKGIISNYSVGICIGDITVENLNQLKDAEIIACLNAQPYSFDKEKDHIKQLKYLSKFTKQAIVYVNSNANESTTDFVFNDAMIIVECGKELTNSSDLDNENTRKFAFETRSFSCEIDIDIIRGARKKELLANSFTNSGNKIVKFDTVEKNITTISRNSKGFGCSFAKKSFYEDPFETQQIANSYDNACEIIDAQAFGLARRLKHINANSVVIGISGGIDSTLALLVCVRCFEILNYDKKNIYTISMPCFGTSTASLEIAKNLANSLDVNYIEIPINSAVLQHFKDIKHPENQHDIVFENTQARQRTMTLFNYANKVNGIVVGTGDMSEIALGWATFNGDHISNYNVNCGVPKTVAKAILESFACSCDYSIDVRNILKEVSKKTISPELLPADDTGKPQSTEEIIGPYELHDFFLYYYLSYFLSEEKLLFIAKYNFSEKYSDEEIEKYFKIFIDRFKKNQYKRSCSTDGPSIFDISLSPRTGLIFPSDL